MAKPDPALLDPSRYPFQYRIEPRFGDLDLNRHINNVAMAAMMEEAHVRFHAASRYAHGGPGLRLMVASVTIDYLAQGAYPAPLDFHVAIEHLGRTSQTLVKLAVQDRRVIAFSRVTIVTAGPQGPTPMPTAFTDQADQWRLGA